VNLSARDILVSDLEEIKIIDPIGNIRAASEGYNNLVVTGVVGNIPLSSLQIVKDFGY
jgi:hypothetical protein